MSWIAESKRRVRKARRQEPLNPAFLPLPDINLANTIAPVYNSIIAITIITTMTPASADQMRGDASLMKRKAQRKSQKRIRRVRDVDDLNDELMVERVDSVEPCGRIAVTVNFPEVSKAVNVIQPPSIQGLTVKDSSPVADSPVTSSDSGLTLEQADALLEEYDFQKSDHKIIYDFTTGQFVSQPTKSSPPILGNSGHVVDALGQLQAVNVCFRENMLRLAYKMARKPSFVGSADFTQELVGLVQMRKEWRLPLLLEVEWYRALALRERVDRATAARRQQMMRRGAERLG